LNSVFIVDTFEYDDFGVDSEARLEIGFYARDLFFTIPVEEIASVEKVPFKTNDYRVNISGQIEMTGNFRLKTKDFSDLKRNQELGVPGSFDYMIGYQGRVLYMIPFSDVKRCETTTVLPNGPGPCEAQIRLYNQENHEIIAVCSDKPDIFCDNSFDSSLAAVAGIILHIDAHERIGIQPYDIQAIYPADYGRVVVETRTPKKQYAGKLLTSIEASYYGATVTLPPSVFKRYKAVFEGGPHKTEHPIKKTSISADITLSSGVRRDISSVFILDSELTYGIDFPIFDDGLLQLIDLRYADTVKQVDSAVGKWSFKMKNSQKLAGKAGFRKAENLMEENLADEIDFLVGFEGKVVDFIPLRAIKSFFIRRDKKPITMGPYGAQGTLDLTGDRRFTDGFNFEFEVPSDMPDAVQVATPSSAFFLMPDGVIRVLEIGVISRIEKDKKAPGHFRISGKIPPFNAKLAGAVTADASWGRFKAEPSCIKRLNFRIVPKPKTLLSQLAGIKPVRLQIKTKNNSMVTWSHAWFADYYDTKHGRSLQHTSSIRIRDAKGERVLPLSALKKIHFLNSSGNVLAGTPCSMLTQDSKEPIDAELLLLKDRTSYGPINDDAIIARINDYCLELIPFEKIKEIKILKGGIE